jgi:hypothetical protein
VPMGERRQRPVLGEAKTNNAISRAETRRRCCRGSACVRDPRAEASGESEVFRDPLCVRPRMKQEDELVCSHILLKAQQGII